jgi:choline kinase
LKAVILAAGIGNRIAPAHTGPKALLRFHGKSLLERHLDILGGIGITDIVIGTGYGSEDVGAELSRLGARHVRCVLNPDFRDGSVVTLWRLREEILTGDDVLLMDADVLYDKRILERLVTSRHVNCLLIDRDFTPGEEPVKLCLKAGRIVEFRKKVEVAYDTVGESIGFFRFDAATCRKLLDASRFYVEGGRTSAPHEEAIRDIALAAPDEYGVEDVTGLAWIEIDFPEDVVRAERDVLPRLTA